MKKSWRHQVGIIMVCATSSLLSKQTVFDKQKSAVKIKPLRAYRPKKDIESFLVAPPYNCLSVSRAREIANNSPLSFLHVSRPETHYDQSVKPYDKVTAYRGKSRLDDFIQKGLLVADSKPAFYIYEQERAGIRSWCIIGSVATSHMYDGLIKPHEAIYPKKKQALIDFIRIENAHVDPVLLMHKSSRVLDALVADIKERIPDCKFIAADDTQHTVWVIDDSNDVASMQYLFRECGPFYIADGHHRCAAVAHLKKNDDKKEKTGKFDYMLAAFIPENHSTILPYHRLVKDLNGLTVDSFLNRLAASFEVQSVSSAADAQPKKAHTFGMYLNKKWYTIRLKKKISRHYKKNSLALLDINLLNRYVHSKFFDIGSASLSGRLECVGGQVSLDQLALMCDKKKWQLAFVVPPVSARQFTQIVDSGMLMPPKTTWFEPKLWQGLFVQMLE